MFRHRSARASSPIVISLVALLAAVSGLEAQGGGQSGNLCPGFPDDQRILRLAGPNAFSKTPVTSVDELRQQLDEHRGEIEALLRQHGLAHLSDAFFEAVASGRVKERNLAAGEVFDWMAFRKNGEATSRQRMCVASTKTWEAFVIEVTDRQETAPEVTCELSARLAACPDRTISVDASGSSSGVAVNMSGPDGESKLTLSGGRARVDASTPGTYAFTGTAEGTGTATLTPHTFVVPKVCLNLAYTGAGASREIAGETLRRTCESGAVQVDECLPTCALTVTHDPDSCKSFTVAASGDYDALSVDVVDEKGKVIATGLSSFPAAVSVKRQGVYSITGTATNAAGSATCSQQATVECARSDVDSRWTVRGFASTASNDDDELFQSRFIEAGALSAPGLASVAAAEIISERSVLKFDGGTGLGLDVEYRLKPWLGIQGSVQSLSMDTSFILDLNDDWERDTDDADLTVFTLGPTFHLTPQAAVDFFVGLFAGQADLGTSSFTNLGVDTEVDFGSEDAFGVLVGLDIPFGKGRWGLHVGARYFELSADIGEDDDNEENELEIDVNPLVGELGLFVRF